MLEGFIKEEVNSNNAYEKSSPSAVDGSSIVFNGLVLGGQADGGGRLDGDLLLQDDEADVVDDVHGVVGLVDDDSGGVDELAASVVEGGADADLQVDWTLAAMEYDETIVTIDLLR